MVIRFKRQIGIALTVKSVSVQLAELISGNVNASSVGENLYSATVSVELDLSRAHYNLSVAAPMLEKYRADLTIIRATNDTINGTSMNSKVMYVRVYPRIQA